MKGTRHPINIKVIFGLTLIAASFALIDARGLTRGSAQFINAWSPLALDLFLGLQAAAGVAFLLFGLAGRHMHRGLFAACVLTTSMFLVISAVYVFTTPDISKVALVYESGFLGVLMWYLFNRPNEVWP